MTTDKDSGALLIAGRNDRFPVGMRVLAVNDDPNCLQHLESMLVKCKYQVTTSTDVITALEMLRENKDKFDLIISDVEMPHMVGFKFLEHVGLEMDLPVIMLSSHSQTELVMKGITRGACDYLSKTARMEELMNMWQHVVRRKKFGSKERVRSAKACDGSSDGECGARLVSTNADQNGNISRKRKDQRKGKEEDGEETGQENVGPLTQKKPRVIWSQELHEKFVSAVHQLGFEKAVPKKILELMNVEGITRENVASHLQKYRLHLKRLDSVRGQAATAQRSKDPFYVRESTVDAYAGYHALAGSDRLSCTALYPPGAVPGRLNTAPIMGSRGIAYSASIQPNNLQHLTASINIPTSQNACFFEGVSTFLDLDRLQHMKTIPNLRGFDSTTPNVSDTAVGPGYRWEEQLCNFNQSLSQTSGATNSLGAAASSSFGSVTHIVEQTNANCSPNGGVFMPIQLNSGADNVLRDSEIQTSSLESNIKSEKYPLEETKLHDNILEPGYESLDELMNAIARLENNETMLTDADFGFDLYPLGSCI